MGVIKGDGDYDPRPGINAVLERKDAEIERLRAVPESIARMIEGYTADQIRMAAGDMTAQEMRTVKAVQRWWASAIRHRFTSEQGAKP